jgi:hypothetical protein
MVLMDYASVVQTYLLWKSFFFHAARPGYTNTVFLNTLKYNQCVYCRQVQDPQDIIDCTPIRIAFSGDASNTRRSQVNAAQESIMSGEALMVPPEAKMSQEEVAANMNPPNIHFKLPVHDEVMNLHEKPVDGQERSWSNVSIVGEEDNNGLLFAPTCSTCFNENKYLLVSEKKCSHQWSNESLKNPGEYIVFPSEMYHRGYYNQKSSQIFTQAQLFCKPTLDTDVLQLPRSMMKEQGKLIS